MRELLLIAFVLACPLMMMFMMRGHGHGGGRADGEAHDLGRGHHGHGDGRDGQPQSERSTADLRRTRDELDRVIAERERRPS